MSLVLLLKLYMGDVWKRRENPEIKVLADFLAEKV